MTYSKSQINMVLAPHVFAPTDGHQTTEAKWQAVQAQAVDCFADQESILTTAQQFYSLKGRASGKSQAQLKQGGWEMAYQSFSQGCLSLSSWRNHRAAPYDYN